jgi:hypothetical protein
LSGYKHPREIENFANLATDEEPIVKRSRSKIALHKDGDGARDWSIERYWGWGLGRTCLAFTLLQRPSPSAMATQTNFRLYYIGARKDEGWWIEDVDRFKAWSISRAEVEKLVPSRFSGWVEKQEDPPDYLSWAA